MQYSIDHVKLFPVNSIKKGHSNSADSTRHFVRARVRGVKEGIKGRAADYFKYRVIETSSASSVCHIIDFDFTSPPIA